MNDLITIDWQKVEEANQIRDEICANNWENLKQNARVLEKTFSAGFETTPAQMLLMDRNFLLEKIFENPNVISTGLKTSVVLFYANYDFSQDPEKIKTDYSNIAKDIRFRRDIDLEKTQKEAKVIANGLANLIKITYYKQAEELMVEIAAIKSLTSDKIQIMYERLNKALTFIQQATNTKRPLNINEINEILSIEKQFGRVELALESLKDENEPIVFLELIRKNRQALNLLEAANQRNLNNNLSDVFTIAQLLEEYEIT